MDFVISLPMTKNERDVVWVVVDILMKITHFIQVNIKYTLEKLAQIYIQEIMRLYGMPSSIVLDREPWFSSRFWIKFQEKN